MPSKHRFDFLPVIHAELHEPVAADDVVPIGLRRRPMFEHNIWKFFFPLSDDR